MRNSKLNFTFYNSWQIYEPCFVYIVPFQILSLDKTLYPLLNHSWLRQKHTNLLNYIFKKLIVFFSLSRLHNSNNNSINNILSFNSKILFFLLFILCFLEIFLNMSCWWYEAWPYILRRECQIDLNNFIRCTLSCFFILLL